MVKRIPARGIGRPDYSQNVEKVALPTPKRRQLNYWFTLNFIIPPKRYSIVFVEKGFDKEHSFVPKGKVFIPERIEFVADANVLLKLDLLLEDIKRNLVSINNSYGYQKVVIEPRRVYKFPENTRPAYGIGNFSDVTVVAHLNVVGTIEDKEDV